MNQESQKSQNCVRPPCIVSLRWRLLDSQGQLLQECDPAQDFLLGASEGTDTDTDGNAESQDLLPSIQKALEGAQVGQDVHLHLEPEQAFGDYDSQLVFLEPRWALPKDLEEGMMLEGCALAEVPEGLSEQLLRDAQDEPHRLYTVTDIYPEHVVLDGNHPLAGMSLNFHLHIEQIRPAT